MTYPSPLAQPPHGAAAPIPPAPAPAPLPVPARKGRSAPLWGFAVIIVVLIALAAYLLSFLGTAASVIAMILALLPLTGVLLTIRVIDRWEPEPRSLTIFAVAWGAIVAVALTLLVDVLLTLVIGVGASPAREAFSTVIQAPVVEELAKGLGLLVLLAVGRRAFDGPVDGVVYGALVGAGFAFTENILYFATSLIEGGVADVTMTFLLRGILSPFAHAMFTAVTGYLLGRAVRTGRAAGRVGGHWLLGVLGATILHAFWNGSAMFADFFALYFTLQVPLFICFIVGIILLRREEARLTRERLGEYAAAGWFTATEVEMLATPRGRRQAVVWARGLPGDRSALMRRFIAEATSLAAARQRALSGRDPHAVEDERVFLARATAARTQLLARP
ncbi:PrsW family intramembrane metalloprotease [Microbacterium sp. MC2]